MGSDTDIVIVGGGLAGLRLADLLHSQGRDFQLLETRDRFGGRILTEHLEGGYFDMGPAWFWPGQPRIDQLTQELNLTRFDQFSQGILTLEDEQGQVQRARGYASMEGSWRLAGGLGALISGLLERLPKDRLHLSSAVTSLAQTNGKITATVEDGRSFKAKNVVLAVPPRLAADRITFTPALPFAATSTMANIPTWMAGQAKAVAVYVRPFWRDAGLSGDAMSRVGPMVEVHDASPKSGGPFALFGFIGVPAAGRTDKARLREAVLAQFGRLFGAQAATPKHLYIKDWAFDPQTATVADQQPVYAHPAYGLPQELQGLWNGTLHFGGTEVGAQFGGFLEGALEAAEAVFEAVSHRKEEV